MSGKKIAVLATGGTIAGTAASATDNVGYTAAQLGIEGILAAIPSLQGRALVAEQVAQIDSKNMSFAVWRNLALRCAHWLAQDDVAGVVITHGTDTLEETAYFLHSVLAATAKPVVLTCAMRPATSLAPDGPQNVADAVTVASCPGACGVVVVCAGTIHRAIDVSKQHTYRLDAFSSADAGPLGFVEEGRVRLPRGWPPHEGNLASLEAVTRAQRWPRVEIVMNHVGASGAVVHALLTQGIDGIVVAGTGNGTLSDDLQASLLQAQARGIPVVRASRCPQGRVIESPGNLLPGAGTLSPVKARIKLCLELLAA